MSAVAGYRDAETVGAGRATILVADDDGAIRTVLTQALARVGFEVKATGTAAGLWALVEAGQGDLVITDVVMPDENGLDLLPRIRKLRPDLRIIVMSAQNTLLTAVKASERGAFEYLPKPFDLDQCAAIARKALSARHEPQQSRDGDRSGRAAAEDEGLPLVGRSAPMQEV